MKTKLFIGILPLLFSLVLISSCRARKPVITGKNIHDSINVAVEYVPRDTNIIVSGAQTELTFTVSKLQDMSDGVILFNSKEQANISLLKSGNTITAQCSCDTLKIEAQLIDKYTSQERTRTITNTIVQEVKFIPWHVRWLSYLGGLTLIFGIIYLMVRFLKPKII